MAKFRLININESWHAEGLLRSTGVNSDGAVVTNGYRDGTSPVQELQQEVQNHLMMVNQQLNEWLDNLEKGGLKHGVVKKHIVFASEEDLALTEKILLERDSQNQVS